MDIVYLRPKVLWHGLRERLGVLAQWSHTRPALAVVATMALMLLFAYEYAAPSIVVSDYNKQLNRSFARMDEIFTRTAASANLSMFNDASVDFATRQQQILSAQELLRQTQTTITSFTYQADSLRRLPASDWLGAYATADVRQAEAYRVVRQSQEALADYRQLLQFLGDYTAMQRQLDTAHQQLSSAAVIRLNTATSFEAQIQAAASKLQTLQPPIDFMPLRSQAIATFNQAAEGFRLLKQGIESSQPGLVASGLRLIQTANDKNVGANKDQLVTLVDTSPTFRRLYELPEKPGEYD